MEVWITDFRNNSSAYFDKVFFQDEEIILKRRSHRVKIVRIDDDIDVKNNDAKNNDNIENWEAFTDKDDKIMDEAIRSEFVRNKLKKLSNLISKKF